MPVAPAVTNKVNPALHALLVTAGTGLIADALTRLHNMAQAGGAAAGVAAIAIAVISWAQHSRQVAVITHTAELDASNLISPQVVARLGQAEKLIADNKQAIEAAAAVVTHLPAVADAARAVENRVKALENAAPAPVKILVDDVRPLVEQAFTDLWHSIAATPAPPVSSPVTEVTVNPEPPAPTAPAADSTPATPAP